MCSVWDGVGTRPSPPVVLILSRFSRVGSAQNGGLEPGNAPARRGSPSGIGGGPGGGGEGEGVDEEHCGDWPVGALLLNFGWR